MMNIRLMVEKILRPKGKFPFINSIKKNGKLFDIGCGDKNPIIIKTMRPDIYYVGIDIEIFNRGKDYKKYIDELIIAKPENFHLKISDHINEFDAIISIHNLEHCNDHQATTIAMINSLKSGGKMYISLPSEDSVNFPSRFGTLNFFDDNTHKKVIIYKELIDLLKKFGLKIVYSKRRYRPVIPYIVGLLCEPFCKLLNKQAPIGGTWAFYGFETIIIAKKL